jgi:hypothetical protein
LYKYKYNAHLVLLYRTNGDNEKAQYDITSTTFVSFCTCLLYSRISYIHSGCSTVHMYTYYRTSTIIHGTEPDNVLLLQRYSIQYYVTVLVPDLIHYYCSTNSLRLHYSPVSGMFMRLYITILQHANSIPIDCSCTLHEMYCNVFRNTVLYMFS